jgi:lipopolysaccharide biosynthesis protein
VNELSKYFDEVVLITNERSISGEPLFLHQNVRIILTKNEGYDLGMFYKVFQTIDPEEYIQIACVNDSNILFNELLPIFNWSKTQEYDFWGIIDSHQKPWFSIHKENYHIQSHFIIFNRRAILKLPAFFESLNIQDILAEKDPKKLRQTVINKWEIGISQFLINEGLSCGSYIDSQLYSDLYLSGKQSNVGLKLYPELIRSGFPLIKIKVITKGKWKDIFRSKSYWKNLIRQYGNPDWNIESLIKELVQIKNNFGNQPIVRMKRKFVSLFVISWKKIRLADGSE